MFFSKLKKTYCLFLTSGFSWLFMKISITRPVITLLFKYFDWVYHNNTGTKQIYKVVQVVDYNDYIIK